MTRREIEAVLRLKDDLSKNIQVANKNLKALNKEVQRNHGELQKIGKSVSFARLAGTIISAQVAMRAFSMAFRGIRDVIAGSIRASSEFNDAFTKSTAIMGDLSEAMQKDMVRAAEEVAKTTTFSAKEAAEAYFFLASAGLDAKQSIEALPQVSRFAQAGAFDLAQATDLLTDAQSALGMTIRDDVIKNMENMSRVSDVLVRANTLANASVEQFSQALTTKAGAALKILGKDVEEGVAVLAAFADQGVKAQEAGTALNIVLRDLSTKAIENADAFAKNKIAVFDSAGEMRNIGDIIADLENRLAGMSDETAKATLRQLGFADKSVIFIQTLIGMSGQIKRYEEELRKAAGTTDEVANKQLASMAAELKLTGDSWQLLLKDIGDFVSESEAVKALLEGVRDLFDFLRDSLEQNRESWIKLVSGGINFALEAFRLILKAIELVNKDIVAQSYVAIKLLKLWAKFQAPMLVPKIEEAENIIEDLAEIGMFAGEAAESIEGLQKSITDATAAQLAFVSEAKGFDQIHDEVKKLGQGAEKIFSSLVDSGLNAVEAFDMVSQAADRASKIELLSAGQLSVFKALESAGFSTAEAFEMVSRSTESMGETINETSKQTKNLGDNFKALEEMAPGFARGFGNSFVSIEKSLIDVIPAVQDVRDEFWGWLETTPTLVNQLGRTVVDFVPQMNAMEKQVKETAEETDYFNEILQQSANLTIIFGRSIGSLIGSLAGAASGFKSLFGGGKGFSGFIQGFQTKTETGFKTTIGSLIGGLASALPAIGAIAGPIVNLFGKIFKPKWKKLAEESAKIFGQVLSEGLSKELLKTATRLGSIENAYAAKIGDIIQEVGVNAGNVSKILENFNDLIGMVENGTLQWSEAVEQVNKAFPELVDYLEELGTKGDFGIGRLVSRMRELGEVSSEVQDFIKEKAESAISHLSKYFDYLLKQEVLTGEQAKNALAVMAGAFEAAVAAAGSLTGAMAMLGENFGFLLEKMRGVLGDENAMLNAMQRYYNFVQNNQEQLAAIEALGAAFSELAQIGIINATNINDFAAAFKDQFDQILGKTKDQNTALAAMGPQIGQLLEAYRELGIEVPQWLADLAQRAKEAGASLEPPEGLPDILKDIRDILYGIAEAFGVAAGKAREFGGAAGEAARQAAQNRTGTPTSDISYQHETPPGGVLFRKPTRIMVGEVPEIVDVRHASRGSGGGGNLTFGDVHMHIEGGTSGNPEEDGRRMAKGFIQMIEGNYGNARDTMIRWANRD